MICYQDRTYCSADCSWASCPRKFTEEDRRAARKWWGGDGAPVAFAGFSLDCANYSPVDPATEGASHD